MIFKVTMKSLIIITVSIFLAIAIALLFSSGQSSKLAERGYGKITDTAKYFFAYHCLSLDRTARHYFLLPEGGYKAEYCTMPLPFSAITAMAANAFFNAFFQPLFLCVFTPQTVLNFLLFPFFLYGAVKYFKKVPIMIMAVIFLYIYTALYGSVIEALIRHRISCELVYLLIGLAGFTDLITRSS